MRDAEAHAEEDKARREEAEVRNQAEGLIYQTEKFLKDNDEKLPEEPKERVKTSITKVNEALKGTDVAAIKSAVEELANESQQLGAALYAQTQAAGADGATGAPGADGAAGGAGGSDGAAAGSGDDEIVDAEIVEDESK
jgi:molecular chaperone DnaK